MLVRISIIFMRPMLERRSLPKFSTENFYTNILGPVIFNISVVLLKIALTNLLCSLILFSFFSIQDNP